ncbi:MAG TPA: His-Xaa-Ser system radical SAM maturase HxsB [Rhizomicrobium sp.]|nr:His-Xaa-Ser system radical SAM maturase HxsB [Rhizomicrobium sp.]
MSVRFRPMEDFAPQGFGLGAVRSVCIPGIEGRVLVTSNAGEYLFLSEHEHAQLLAGDLPASAPSFDDLVAKQIISHGPSRAAARMAETKLRTRKAFLRDGPSLHIFVVSLRCDHSCFYCQVSRQGTHKTRFDMSSETARAAVERMFEAPTQELTVEFQGGEPLLAFDRIAEIVALIEERRTRDSRRVTYTITSTLHHVSDSMLAFFEQHQFQVSTSLDGPDHLHNANRPTPSGGAHARTLAGLARAREVLGAQSISALTTLTRESLAYPEAIVDEYVRLGFKSVFLRPLSPYGFAKRSERKLGYDMAAFLPFYERALAHILALNRDGVEIEEVYASILLSHILTPFASRYVDLRSPAGAGLGVLVYNYDGGVYASDESRMLAETGDITFRLGSVHEPYADLMRSPAMARLAHAGVAEDLPVCRDCAFLPYCGADPVQDHATGTALSDRLSSPHCVRHMGLFRILFRYLEAADPDVMQTFLAWVLRKPRASLAHGDR